MFYLFTRRELPEPGAMAFALATYQEAPGDLTGGGKRYSGCMAPLEGAGVLPCQTMGTVGLGGVYTGQMIMQPLYDLDQDGVPSQQLFGQTPMTRGY